MKILIMGLPGSGKTYLAKRLQPLINAAWYNADVVRNMANDWDFSPEGRIRQSMRMKTFADFEKSNNRFVICDFVCPTKQTKVLHRVTQFPALSTTQLTLTGCYCCCPRMMSSPPLVTMPPMSGGSCDVSPARG